MNENNTTTTQSLVATSWETLEDFARDGRVRFSHARPIAVLLAGAIYRPPPAFGFRSTNQTRA